MSRTTRVRILSQRLLNCLTSDQAVMTVDVDALNAAAATVAAGAALTGAQRTMLTSAQHALGTAAPLTGGATMSTQARTQLAAGITALADTAAIGQRARIAAAVTSTLRREGWLVTVVEGGEPDRYTGIEATRGSEHLVAAAGAGELIADQAGAHDCAATVQALAAGLRQTGCAIEITDDTPHDGAGGTLYSLPGGPTRAHAVQASLRRSNTARRPRQRAAARNITASASGDGRG